MSSRHCRVETLAETVSPNGVMKAYQEVGYCDDGKEEHRLVIGPRVENRGSVWHSSVFLERIDNAPRDISTIPRLRLAWIDNEELKVEYPEGKGLELPFLLGEVSVSALPIKSHPNNTMEQTGER